MKRERIDSSLEARGKLQDYLSQFIQQKKEKLDILDFLNNTNEIIREEEYKIQPNDIIFIMPRKNYINGLINGEKKWKDSMYWVVRPYLDLDVQGGIMWTNKSKIKDSIRIGETLITASKMTSNTMLSFFGENPTNWEMVRAGFGNSTSSGFRRDYVAFTMVNFFDETRTLNFSRRGFL